MGSILPSFLKDSLLKIDNEIENNTPKKYSINRYWWQIGMYVCFGLLI